MNFATPAIAINYEHNPPGLCNNWGYQRWQLIFVIIRRQPASDGCGYLRPASGADARLSEAVSRERQTGMQMVQSYWNASGRRNEGRLLLIEISLSSETFVLNQITAFIDMGFEWRLSRCKKATPRTPTRHGRIQPCRQNPLVTGRTYGQSGELRHRASQTLRGIHRKNTWQASTSNAMVLSRET